ncbi:hypothetical protein GLOIN_2v1476827 [Rhizophagus irregularis DAOM 181602=DAOM 197198]|nr:hypothetical protein GLOIN_2v1476827 [Rhizophagus irregularis DAOM 181602=DAOM 197198]
MNLDILDDQGNSQPQSQPSQETEVEINVKAYGSSRVACQFGILFLVSIRYSSIRSVLFSASESGSVLFSASESGSVLFLVSPLFNARFQVPVLSALQP